MAATAPTESKRARRLLPALALCIAAIAAYAWPREQTATPTDDTSGAGASHAGESTASNRPGAAANDEGVAPETVAAKGRTDAINLTRTHAPDSSTEPQGLRGLVVDQRTRPIPGVSVYLVESASNDPLLFPKVQQQRHLLAPIASTKTAADGTFAVGLAVAQRKVYDVFLLSDHHATVRRTGLRLLPDTWHDMGMLMLETGTTIRGRVTVAGQLGMPVPQAVVTVSSGGVFADAAMRALPGEQGALIAQVNSNGEYELDHAPSSGIVRISAIAPGFAQVVKQDVELKAGSPATVDFELPPGKTLRGDVRTSTGLPIPDARIEALPKKADLPALVAFSDENGAFFVHGMRGGLHTIRASAKGFAKTEKAEVQAGQLVLLTMVPQNRIHVLARTPTGRLLRSYQLGLRRFFPKDHKAPLDEVALRLGTIGSIHEVRDQRVRLTAGNEFAEIVGVPDGIYVCEVEADGFAKTLSLPVRFPIPASEGPAPAPGTPEATAPEWLAAALPPGAAQQIEVVVSNGHRLRGQVVDRRGVPMKGAVVTTQPAGTMPDSPMLRIMQGWTPKRIAERTQRTDANGRFVLERLALATYQLQVEHPDACRTLIRSVDCNQPGEQTLPPITLAQGSRIEGLATAAGRRVGQMKVILTTSSTTPADTAIRLETVTDGEGRYRFARRIPPGSYELRTAVVGGTNPDSEIFNQLLQLKRSSKTFVVPSGQDVVQVDLNLPSAK